MTENQNQSPAIFNPPAEVALGSDTAAIARAVQEVQAALVIAKRFPRDEIKAKSKIIQACQRKELAESGEYEYSRGGTKITGPTIDLLRVIASRWGNLTFGWQEVERRDGESTIRCQAWDLENNGQAFRSFVVKHWRDTQQGGYLLKDERDIYELLANQAARRVRACLEEVIDADIVQAAVDQCRRTLIQGDKTPMKDQIVAMLNAFIGEFGVTQEMLEKRLGNKLDSVSPIQLASLRRVFKSLKDGVGKREDYFRPELEKAQFEGATPSAAPAAPAPVHPADVEETMIKGATATAPTNGGYNPLKALRGLCAAAQPKIKEGKLLEFLGATGASDGSVGSLDELYMANSEVVKALADTWSDVVSKFREWDK